MVIYVWSDNLGWLQQVDVGSVVPRLWGRDQTVITCAKRDLTAEDKAWNFFYVAHRDDAVDPVGWCIVDRKHLWDKKESEQHPLGWLITKGLIQLYGSSKDSQEIPGAWDIASFYSIAVELRRKTAPSP